MLDAVTRTAALLALAYRRDARRVAAYHAEVATLLGNRAEARAWDRVASRLLELGPAPRRGAPGRDPRERPVR